MAALYAKLLQYKYSFCLLGTVHNTFYNKRILTRLIYKNFNLVACGSMVKANLKDYYGLDEKNVHVIHNAVKPFEQSVEIVRELEDLKNKGYYLVGNVGRLSEQKGMEYFIQSFPTVKSKHSKVKYIIIGDGEDRDKLNELVKSLGIEEDIIFLGYRSDIQNVMLQLDCVVLSSLWEGLPLTPIEAFSVGKTVIGTAVDVTVEIIHDGIDGFLIQPKSKEEIATRVNQLIEHPEQKAKFEQNALKTYQREFSFEKFAERYVDYYRYLVSKYGKNT